MIRRILYISFLLIITSCTKEIAPAKIEVATTDVEFITIQSPIDDITLWNNKNRYNLSE